MIPLGLSARDRRAYLAALTQSRRIRIVAHIRDRNEKVISTISSTGPGTGKILGGQVNIDMAGTPNRTLELNILEPRKAPAWLPSGPSDFHVFADNFINVLYCIWVADLSDGPGWVDVPVFWGPIVGLSQDGVEVTIQAAGKEVRGLDPFLLWKSMQLHKGRRRTAVIRDVMAETGEARFDLPDLPQKLPKRMDLNRHAQPYHVAEMIAGGADWQVFYNGRGQLKVRRWPQNRMYTFKDGPTGTILNRPVISYDITSIRNVVEVLGPEPKGPPTRIRAVANARAKHPLSAQSLRRNGQNQWMVERVDSNLSKPELEWHASHDKTPHKKGGMVQARWGAPSGVKHPLRWLKWRASVIAARMRKARDIAKRHLANRLRATIETEFETLVIPHLEEGDPCAVSVEGWHTEFIFKTCTIPLQDDAPMTVGITKRVPKKKRRKQKKGHIAR